MEVSNGSILHEVQVEAGDTKSNASHAQERQACDTGDMPHLRDEGVPNRESVGVFWAEIV